MTIEEKYNLTHINTDWFDIMDKYNNEYVLVSNYDAKIWYNPTLTLLYHCKEEKEDYIYSLAKKLRKDEGIENHVFFLDKHDYPSRELYEQYRDKGVFNE